MKILRLEKDEMIKDVRNLFTLKKEISDTTVTDIRNFLE